MVISLGPNVYIIIRPINRVNAQENKYDFIDIFSFFTDSFNKMFGHAVNKAKYSDDKKMFLLEVVIIGKNESMVPSLVTANMFNSKKIILTGKRISLIFAMVFNPFVDARYARKRNGIVIMYPGVFVKKKDDANILTTIMFINNMKIKKGILINSYLFFLFLI